MGQNRKPSIASPNHISTGSGGLQDVPQHPEKSIDELVQEVRLLYHDKIEYDCGQMQLLNRQGPIDDLYTDVYVLEDIPKLRSLNIFERMQGFDLIADDPNSFYLGKVPGERVPGLEIVTDGCKVMCLGAPGSGKTTYLYYVAIQCNKGELQANRVPIFIRLIEFTDSIKNQPELSLLSYIENLLHTEGVEQPQAIEKIITQGRALILLDGLDEVPKDFSKLVLSRIREFCKYRNNSIIITCRTNALDYNFSNLKFTQVIVADFEQLQIEIFANKWFVAVAKNDKQAGEARAKKFIEKLGLPEHKRIRDIAVTPILLNLTCLVFKNNMGEFPKNRSELYQRGINILLKEWDAEKGIERDEVYGKLDLEGRKALLTHVAKVSFDENRYFFKQEEIEKYIADYLRTLPHAQLDSLQTDSRAVLKSIEVQHGLLMERAPEIYSFSHLTFQEYFTAKWFCDGNDLEGLAEHVAKKHWREVFLLTVEMMKVESGDKLLELMKKEIDDLVIDQQLQDFLKLIKQKSDSELLKLIKLKSDSTPRKIAVIRAICFSQNLGIIKSVSANSDTNNNCLNIKNSLSSINDNTNSSNISTHLEITDAAISSNFISFHDLSLAQDIEEDYIEEHFVKSHLQLYIGIEQANSLSQQFSNEQKKLLQQYYDANKLLVDCLNIDSKVSQAVKEEIEEMLLLPIAEIKKRQQQM